jgi:hypothetical protein
MTDDIVVTVNDFRSSGICPKARLWFEKNGLDWRDFVRNGIPVSKLKAVGDQMTNIERVEAAARSRMNGW